jgi:DNA-binding transcriptional ArsR family regulator
MKQLTEIDDPRLVKGLAHPLRVSILRVLENRVASPSEIADELAAPLGNVSYHVRFLARVGLIELARTKPRRGAVEHYYRSAGRVRVTDKAWAQVPDVVKTSLIGSTLDQIGRSVGAAAAEGGFDGRDVVLSRREPIVDQQGFQVLALAYKELLDLAAQVERDSAERLAGNDHVGVTMTAGMVLMLFQAASSPGPRSSPRPGRKRRTADL